MFLRTFACILASFWLTGLAAAQAPPAADWDGESHRFGLRAGLGFTAGPGTFLTAIEVPYSLTRNWTIGLLLQIGVDDHETLIAPTLNTRYFPNLGLRASNNDFVRRVEPYIHGGLGLLHIDLDTPAGDVDDTAFLFNTGIGIDFPISRRVTIGSQMSFNVVPGGALGENFFFSWQLITAQLRF
jgi:hypothetical protein